MTERSEKTNPDESTEEGRLILSALHKYRTIGDKKERLEYLESLASLRAPWTTPVFLEALDDPCQAIGAKLVHELGKSESLDVNRLCARLKNSPWYVKNRVLQILGLLRNPQTVKHIAGIIHEPNAEVRRTAAGVLVQIGGQEALGVLLHMVKDSNPFVRKTVEKAIQQISRLRFT